jgi:hypothetical protein
MAFMKSEVSVPHILEPGSCHAERIHATLAKPVVRLVMTREESELKQLAYERERAKWRKDHPPLKS